MSSVKQLTLLLVLLPLLLSAAETAAQDSAPQNADAFQAAPLGTAFTYQGQLTEGENPANGFYDFQFLLYDAASGGNQVRSAVTKNEVAVSGGIFTTKLNFGNQAFEGSARYLEVRVRRGSSTGGFTILAPRQELTPTPYALALPGVIPRDGNVGIGTTTPNAPLTLQSATEDVLTTKDHTGHPRFALYSNHAVPFFHELKSNNYDLRLSSFVAGGSGGNIEFHTGTNTASEKVRIDANGYVGIGTTDPIEQLHVKGTEPVLVLQDSDSSGASQGGYVSLRDSSQVERGWFGFGDTGNTVLGIANGYPGGVVAFYGNSHVGIRTTSPNDALDVVGNIDATGCIQTDDSGSIGGTCMSDRRLKENIQNFSTSLDKIISLNPVTFEWREEAYAVSHDSGAGVGLLAQEVEQVFPQLVTADEAGYKRVRYDIELQMHMLQAIKELAAENAIQRGQIVDIGTQRRGTLEELEKAHIYIEQLHMQTQVLEGKNANLKERITVLETRLTALEGWMAEAAQAQTGGGQ